MAIRPLVLAPALGRNRASYVHSDGDQCASGTRRQRLRVKVERRAPYFCPCKHRAGVAAARVSRWKEAEEALSAKLQ